MEALAKVVLQIRKQWGINCKPKDFTFAVARLMQIGVIDQPVDVLHPEIWDKHTKALAQETMSSGHGKNLKAWGKVVQALQKAIQDQETWKVAEKCLLAAPKLGDGATTQTLCPPTTDVSNSDSAAEEQERVGTSYSELAKEARTVMKNADSETVKDKSPPYVSQNGAEGREEGRGESIADGKRGEVTELMGVCGEEGVENSGEGVEKGDASDRKGGRHANGEKNVNQKEKYLHKASAPSRGRDKQRGKNQIIGRPHNPYVAVPEKNDGLTDVPFVTNSTRTRSEQHQRDCRKESCDAFV
ncbi:hypothetical protein WISP_83409 [Willisornis vidua]|uniref:Retroviral Gag polyprotein M domain-containing protein n=1 Tax=Willisornis vidua TaxID=1566151 RepID=A0ABQ9D3U3_9PASS|nr:hypothetical protein WISP_83409 [Willisornis vidua]